MPYSPHTEADIASMLDAAGVSCVEDLFQAVPSEHRYPVVDLPSPASEMEILEELNALASKNRAGDELSIFLGAGAYHHFVPGVVPYLAGRGEFATAYTPYQPEVSQGTLQAIFEYQSMMARLTGMDVVNASHYDGATAMAEAAIMAVNAAHGRRHKVILSPGIHPQYRQTLRTYLPDQLDNIVGDEDLEAGLSDLAALLDEETACLIVQNPDFCGRLLDVDGLSEVVHAAGALLIVVANPIICLGILKPPGAYGADIVAAEGQPLGVGLNFGGPYLGVIAASEQHVRRMPGRLVGETVDTQGRRGFVLTLTPREQHIRREKATSNICTNQGLVALMSAIYLSYMGRQGLLLVAEQCYHKAHYAAELIDNLPGYRLAGGAFFNEFAIECPLPVAEIKTGLLERGILGGYDLQASYPHAHNQMLLCVTEMNTRRQIDALVSALGELSR
jgi:glycine dehydrogenase subunit 1